MSTSYAQRIRIYVERYSVQVGLINDRTIKKIRRKKKKYALSIEDERLSKISCNL